jgi:hypothetical protein
MAGDATMARGPGRRRWLSRRGDLLVRTFPEVRAITLADRARVVDEVRDWAEGQAGDAIDWYLRDKNMMRVWSRLLRGLTVVLFFAGGIAPLVNVARGGDAGGWGYVLLAAAAGCAAFDHFFGVSSAWMRDMTAIQAIQRRLTDFRMVWAARLLRPPAPGAMVEVDDAELAGRLELIGALVADVTVLVEAETTEWLAEFRSNMVNLYGQVGLPRIAE